MATNEKQFRLDRTNPGKWLNKEQQQQQQTPGRKESSFFRLTISRVTILYYFKCQIFNKNYKTYKETENYGL